MVSAGMRKEKIALARLKQQAHGGECHRVPLKKLKGMSRLKVAGPVTTDIRFPGRGRSFRLFGLLGPFRFIGTLDFRAFGLAAIAASAASATGCESYQGKRGDKEKGFHKFHFAPRFVL